MLATPNKGFGLYLEFDSSSVELNEEEGSSLDCETKDKDLTSLEKSVRERLNRNICLFDYESSSEDEDQMCYLTEDLISNQDLIQKVQEYNKLLREFYIPMSQEVPMINHNRVSREAHAVYQKLYGLEVFAKGQSEDQWLRRNCSLIEHQRGYLLDFISRDESSNKIICSFK